MRYGKSPYWQSYREEQAERFREEIKEMVRGKSRDYRPGKPEGVIRSGSMVAMHF